MVYAISISCISRLLEKQNTNNRPTTRRNGRNEMPEYLTVQQAAELLGLHRNTVYKLIHLGKIPAYKLGPKLIRLKVTDVQEHLQKELI